MRYFLNKVTIFRRKTPNYENNNRIMAWKTSYTSLPVGRLLYWFQPFDKKAISLSFWRMKNLLRYYYGNTEQVKNKHIQTSKKELICSLTSSGALSNFFCAFSKFFFNVMTSFSKLSKFNRTAASICGMCFGNSSKASFLSSATYWLIK